MQLKCSLKNAQVLGFTIVLILTLTLAGLTCYKGAEILGLYKTEQALDSFMTLGRTINGTAVQADGTRNSLPIRIDEETAIVGWCRGSQMVLTTTGVNHYDIRPKECGSNPNACLCLCRHYDWSGWDLDPFALGLDLTSSALYDQGGSQLMKCKEKWQCYTYGPEIDFPRKLGKEQYGLDYAVEGGFFIAKNSNIFFGKDIESRLKAVYVVKEGGMIGVLFNPDGLTPEVIKHQEDYNTAKGIYFEAHNAYGAKNWDLAITKYKQLIDSNLADLLTDAEHDEAYWYLGMAYYRKGENQNAITALEKAADEVRDDSSKAEIERKIEEIKAKTG